MTQKARKKWPWQHSQWWKLRQLKKQQSELNASIDALLSTVDDPEEGSPPGFQDLSHRLAAIEEDIEWLLDQTLIARARRWHIYIPHEQKDLWETKYYRKRRVLTPQAQRAIREQMFQRQLAVFAIVVGLSSIVQAVFSILSCLIAVNGHAPCASS